MFDYIYIHVTRYICLYQVWVDLFIRFVMLWLRCFGFVLYMWFEPSQLSCLGSSVGKSVHLASGQWWVRIPPEAVFLFEKWLPWASCVVLLCLSVVLPSFWASHVHVYTEAWEDPYGRFRGWTWIHTCMHVCDHERCLHLRSESHPTRV